MLRSRLAVVSWLAIVASQIAGCGPSIPTRYVLERDVDQWSYRRYQHVLDVEFAIEGNPASGHTATYVQRARGTSREIPYANVFVSVYERPQGLAAEVRRLVRALASYEVSVRDLGGGKVWYLDAGPGDRWAVWVSGPYVVKVGASEGQDDVPEPIVSAYMGIYSSDLDENGRARDGTASAGDPEEPAAPAPEAEGEGDEVPGFLRPNAPR
ncbi:MAG: hypothetical protein AB7S26_12700 [Sandaracinaceae bacterium]